METFEILNLQPAQPGTRSIARLRVRIGENVFKLKVRRSRADGSPYLLPTLASFELEQAIVAEVLRRLQTTNP